MILRRAKERAESLGPFATTAAARLYADIEWEQTYGGMTDRAGYENGEDALAILEERFPHVRANSQKIVEAGYKPRLSATAKRNLAGAVSSPAAGTGTLVVNGDDGAVAASRTKVAARRAVYQASRAPRYARQAAVQVDQATGGYGSIAFKGVLAATGLALLYLVLAGRGPQGLGKLFVGLTNLLGWVINPAVDPLRPPKGAVA